jgi:hypothetical protein
MKFAPEALASIQIPLLEPESSHPSEKVSFGGSDLDLMSLLFRLFWLIRVRPHTRMRGDASSAQHHAIPLFETLGFLRKVAHRRHDTRAEVNVVRQHAIRRRRVRGLDLESINNAVARNKRDESVRRASATTGERDCR